MNEQSLKTELQQVLDNDLVLRKEFNELKRSLSDYRNQLIMRDEDCKRLQVTIDVLNTKLLVLERDNTNYKSELIAFKELRGTIKEQLDDKQSEIDNRLNEIHDLKNDLNNLAVDYELKIENIKNEAALELENVTAEFSSQISELKSNAFYTHSGIKDEYENRLSELTMQWADSEQGILFKHEEQISTLEDAHHLQIQLLTNNYEKQLLNLGNSSQNDVIALKSSHESEIESLVDGFNSTLENLELAYKSENERLKHQLEQQKDALTAEFDQQIENLKNEQALNESILISGYEQQIDTLKTLSISGNEHMSLDFQTQISNLRLDHQQVLQQKDTKFLDQIETLTQKYDQRLSNTIIHATTQNSKLAEVLENTQVETDRYQQKMRTLSIFLDSQNFEIENLVLQVSVLQKLLSAEAKRFEQLNNEFENHKQNASLSTNAQVEALNGEIEHIRSAHNENVNLLNLRIEDLELEVETLTEVFESTTNALSATENLLDGKIEELAVATQVSETLNLQYTTLQTLLSTKDNEFEAEKISLQNSFKSELENKELEFQKLLAENSNLINEIDLAQDNIEAKEAEISILNVEFNDLKSQSIGKSEYFKETLSTKNFEITNLEANNAALTEEISQLKLEIRNIKEQHAVDSLSSDAINQLKATVSILSDEKNKALNEIDQTQTVIGELNAGLEVLNEKLRAYEVEIASLKLTGNSEAQDAFIDRLFKQIDALNDQRLALLDEKEQMAGQLLKMNAVIGHISQQVDSEQIDVTSLNNHRKNVILAKNSSESDDGFHMKEQINDLVREIDKCIALLST